MKILCHTNYSHINTGPAAAMLEFRSNTEGACDIVVGEDRQEAPWLVANRVFGVCLCVVLVMDMVL